LKKHKDFEIILIRKDPAKTEVVLEQEKLKVRSLLCLFFKEKWFILLVFQGKIKQKLINM